MLALKGLKYQFKTTKKDNKYNFGFIAQDLIKLFPELVTSFDGKLDAINYLGLIPILVEAIKEQETRIKSQNDKILKIEKNIKKLSVKKK